MTHRFGPDARLKSRDEFKTVEAGGRRVSGRYVTVVGRPNGRERDRLGIIASKRVGDAVRRNRAKRRLRELFRREVVAGAVGLDLVVIARPGLSDAPFAVLKADFLAALSKLRGAR